MVPAMGHEEPRASTGVSPASRTSRATAGAGTFPFELAKVIPMLRAVEVGLVIMQPPRGLKSPCLNLPCR